MKWGFCGVIFYAVVLQFEVTIGPKTAPLLIMQLSSSAFLLNVQLRICFLVRDTSKLWHIKPFLSNTES